MAKFRYKKIDGGKVIVSKTEHHFLYGVSWRFGSTRTVDDTKKDIRQAEAYIDQYIEERKKWSLSQLVDAYPSHYKLALERTSGEKAILTYKQAVRELIDYMQDKVSQNTIYSRVRFLERMGREFDLNHLDVTLLSAQEVNRVLLKKHEKLGSGSMGTFDTGLAAFKWLFMFLKDKGYTSTDLLDNYKIVRPVKTTSKRRRKRGHYEAHELTFIYDMLDDRRHRLDEKEILKIRHELLNAKRRGEEITDHQFFKAHYKVRQILQLMLDTGLRSGEVAVLRKRVLNGAVILDSEIDFESTLWLDLEEIYDDLMLESVYADILRAYPLSKINIGNLGEYYKPALRFSFEEKTSFINTLKFLDKFENDDLVYWRDFDFKRWHGGDVAPTKRNLRNINFEDIASIDKDIFWMADAVPGIYAELLVEATISKGINEFGEVYWFVKEGTKTDSGADRIIPLNKRARDTLSKVWRDIIKLEQSDTKKIDYLFLNQEGKFYDPSAVTNAWTKLNAKLRKIRPSLPTLSPHKLRHSYLTMRAKNSKTMDELLELRDEAGHRHLSTTLDVYVHRPKGYSDTGKSSLD